MSRIRQAFAALDGGKALIPYIAVGDPDIRTTLALMHGMVASGADILELGVPFSDPMADGLGYSACGGAGVGKRDFAARCLGCRQKIP